MSVILDIDMPQSCMDCPLAFKGKVTCHCQIQGRQLKDWRSRTSRQPDCPLKEVEK